MTASSRMILPADGPGGEIPSVTTHWQTQDAARFQLILNRLPQMVWANEPGGKSYYNRQWFDFTGIDPEVPLDRLSLVHPEDREAAEQAWREAQSSGKYEVEYRLLHRSGEYRWILSRGTPERDEQNCITSWFGTCTDFHDRKLTGEALATSEALNRTIVDSSADPMFLVGPDRRVLFINEAAKRALTIPDAASLVGRDIVEAFGDFAKQRTGALLSALQGKRAGLTLERPGPDGKLSCWDLALTPVLRDGDVVAALLVARNVTELRDAERKLKAMQQELIYASRQSAMGTMAATLAHELNQPLAAMANYSSGLRNVMNASEPDRRQVHQAALAIRENALRAGEIIRRMRAMARGQGVATALLNVADVVKNVVHFAEVECGDVAFEFDLDEDVLVEADSIQLQQVLLNLLKNACQAMSSSRRKAIKISAKRIGDNAEVCVADTGPGVPDELLELIFDADVTTKDEGMGIGLSISRTIVEALGGGIWVENGDEGARLCFAIPCVAGPDLEDTKICE